MESGQEKLGNWIFRVFMSFFTGLWISCLAEGVIAGDFIQSTFFLALTFIGLGALYSDLTRRTM